jgi:LPXTG-motif cell wall-anchored protein
LKKLMLSVVMLAMVLVAAAPAIAQVKQNSEQRVESGDASQTFTVAGSGVSANQCAAILVAAQSGNGVNSTGVLQANGDDDEGEVNNSGNLAVSPELAEECEQKINQAASASTSKAAPPQPPPPPQAKAEEKKAEEKKAEEKKAEEKKAEEKKAEEKKQLPKTGGESASLFALGTGALLVAGGLLARRILK